MLTRLYDWPERLAALIAERRETSFSFGVHDCALFACDAVLAMTGTDIAARFRPRYSDEAGARLLLAEKNLARMALEVAREFDMQEFTLPWAAPRGSVLLLHKREFVDYTLAINDGRWAVAPGATGLEFVPLSLAVKAWRV